ncbi:MAG: class I SAM-dependent methyltransferase [Candidatus Magasanikbacteria bacterium]
MLKKIKILPSDKGYNLAAQDYDRKETYLNSFEKDLILPLLDDIFGKKILDVGAGTGRLTLRLAKQGAFVTALDMSGEMLKVMAGKSPHVELVVGDAEDLPFEKNSFDFVIATFLIVHLKNPMRFFDEAYRVLKDGGRLLITNINQKDPPEIKTKEGVIKIESYYHRPEKIIGMLQELAFTIEKEKFVKEGENWVNQIILATK